MKGKFYKMKKSIIVKGTEYNSVRAAVEAAGLNVSPNTVQKFIDRYKSTKTHNELFHEYWAKKIV